MCSVWQLGDVDDVIDVVNVYVNNSYECQFWLSIDVNVVLFDFNIDCNGMMSCMFNNVEEEIKVVYVFYDFDMMLGEMIF